MPLDKIILIIVGVLGAAAITIYMLAALAGAYSIGPLGIVVLLPLALVIYIIVRVIRERTENAEDDHYDKIEK